MDVSRLEILLILLGCVGVLAVIASRLRLPVPIMMVLGGAGIAMIPGLPQINLEPDLVFIIFLPPLLFTAAFWFPWDEFRSNLGTILVLAVGLVLATMVCVAFAAHWLVPALPLSAAFVLGAIVSPPDAVAATSVFHHMRVPQRLVSVLEGESLLNDSVGLVAYVFAVAAVVTGQFSFANASFEFVWMSFGGIGVGLLTAWGTSHIYSRISDPSTSITLSILTPYGAYLAAEQIGVSGVLAVVAAGLYLGHRASKLIDSATRLQASAVWGFGEYFLNGAIFILIGLEFPVIMEELKHIPVAHLFGLGAAISLVVILVRFGAIFSIAEGLRRFQLGHPIVRSPNRTGVLTVASWAGMRGAVSLAAALAVPLTIQNGEPFPGRPLILFLTYCVIFSTLVLQGITLPWVVKKCRIEEEEPLGLKELNGRLALLSHIVNVIREENADSGSRVSGSTRKFLLDHFETRLRHLEEAIECPPSTLPESALDLEFLDRLMQGGRAELNKLYNEGRINGAVRRLLILDLDGEEFRLHRFLKK